MLANTVLLGFNGLHTARLLTLPDLFDMVVSEASVVLTVHSRSPDNLCYIHDAMYETTGTVVIDKPLGWMMIEVCMIVSQATVYEYALSSHQEQANSIMMA